MGTVIRNTSKTLTKYSATKNKAKKCFCKIIYIIAVNNVG